MAKVLVVEDDIGLLGQLAAQFAAAGYQVETATDGEWVASKLEATTFDLVVTDIVMPLRDGGEVVLMIKQRRPQAKVIAISGGYRAKSEGLLGLAQRLGADATLAKPFRNAELLELAASLLNEGPEVRLAAAG